jgi:kumamolisin
LHAAHDFVNLPPRLNIPLTPEEFMVTRLATRLRASCAALALACAPVLAPAAAHAAVDIFGTVRAPAGVTVSALADNAPMRVILALPLRDPAGAQNLADAVSDPHSPLYGHYITPAQFGARFGADAATYEYLRNWATSLGFEVAPRTSARTTISLSGTAHQFAALFSTRFGTFQTAGHGDGQVTLIAPRLPDVLVGRVSGVIGLSFAKRYAPLFHLPSGSRANVGTGYKNSGYAPSDIRTAYDIPAQTNTAKTEIAGLFEQGGYVVKDLTTYESEYNLPAVPVTEIKVDKSGTGAEFGVLPEDMLDLDVLIGLNPNLAGIRMYIDSKDSFQTALLDALNDMAEDDLCKVISISYGQSESDQGTSAIAAENTALVQLKAQGQTVFASSGDSGADNLNVSDPASQPNITAVGGTTMNTVKAGGAWASETTWSDGGGGISAVWSIPSFQVVNGVSVAAANGGSSTFRNVPDVAADANPDTGYSIYCPGLDCEDIGWGEVGGTSLASPIWAAMTTIINSDRVNEGKTRVGYFDPTVYSLAEVGTGFHDITVGNNGSPGYTAGPGFDDVTGWGSIDLGAFLPTILAKP